MDGLGKVLWPGQRSMDLPRLSCRELEFIRDEQRRRPNAVHPFFSFALRFWASMKIAWVEVKVDLCGISRVKLAGRRSPLTFMIFGSLALLSLNVSKTILILCCSQ
jgi:hypothetical protein